MKKTDERTPKSCSPTTGRKPKAFYISFYESVLKLNIMTTVAIIGDWKPVENNTFHYSVRETKVQNTMSGPVFPTQPCPGVCTLWCLIHLAQKHWKHWRCSRPMQGLHPLLLFRFKSVHSERTSCSHKQGYNNGENYCTESINSSLCTLLDLTVPTN